MSLAAWRTGIISRSALRAFPPKGVSYTGEKHPRSILIAPDTTSIFGYSALSDKADSRSRNLWAAEAEIRTSRPRSLSMASLKLPNLRSNPLIRFLSSGLIESFILV